MGIEIFASDNGGYAFQTPTGPVGPFDRRRDAEAAVRTYIELTYSINK